MYVLAQQVAGFVRVPPLLKRPHMRAWYLRQLGPVHTEGVQLKLIVQIHQLVIFHSGQQAVR